MKCPKCQAENPETRKFCRECGAKLVQACPNCGCENLPGDKFCGECGHSLALPQEPIPQALSFEEKLDKIQSYLPDRLTEKVLAQLETRFPGLTTQVEVADVATPVTIERFTGNYHGAQAWMDEKSGMLDMLRGRTKTLPNLEGFYMAGQWAGGIGLTTSAIQGRKTIETICKRGGQRFATSVP